MEIKILVKENERAELDKFIETCKEHGMELIREGGGKLPNFSGYYAEFKGVRWQKADTGYRQSNIPDVNQQSEQLLAFAEYIKTKTLTSLIGEPQHYVDIFLKANNCG
jgi:hypothetical protein